MATWYVNSAAAGTGAGTSWTNACTTIAAAITLSAAGDDFNVLKTHAETSASIIALNFKGTAASPNRVFSCDNTNSPAQSSDLSAGASVTYTGTAATGVRVTGCVYIYGLTFSAASTVAPGILLANANPSSMRFDGCSMVLAATTAAATLQIGQAIANCSADFNNTTVSFGAVGQSIMVNTNFHWRNTVSALVGAAVPTAVFGATNTGNCIVVNDGVDFSAAGSGKTLVPAGVTNTAVFHFVNCKFGAGVTVAATPNNRGGSITYVSISDSSGTTYRQEKYDYRATLTTDTTDIRAGGASDGTTPIAWKVVTTANANWWDAFECFEILKWNSAVGSPITASVPVMSNATLTTADIWAEAEYLGDASSPRSLMATGGTADALATGSAWATDGVSSWTTTGVVSPVQQLLSVTFTPQQVGWVRIKVKVAKPSQTLRIDPLIQGF